VPLIYKALQVVKTATRNNDRRLKYPDLFTPISEGLVSPLRWKADLVKLKELLIALDVDGAISEMGGKQVDFNKLVYYAQKFLNVEFKEKDTPEIKREILRRTRNVAVYMDTLSDELRDYQERRAQSK